MNKELIIKLKKERLKVILSRGKDFSNVSRKLRRQIRNLSK